MFPSGGQEVTVKVNLKLDQDSLSALNPIGSAAKNQQQTIRQATGGNSMTAAMSAYSAVSYPKHGSFNMPALSSQGDYENTPYSLSPHIVAQKKQRAWDNYAMNIAGGTGNAASLGWGGLSEESALNPSKNRGGATIAEINGTKEHLKSFGKDVTKAAASLTYLTSQSHGFAAAMQRAISVLATVQTISSSASALGSLGSALSSGGVRGLIGAAGGAGSMLTAGATLGVGLAGYGLYHGTESGDSYFGSLRRTYADIFGGGRVNSRGMWISQDRQQGNTNYRFSESMRRTAMQAPGQSIQAEAMEGRFYNQQSFDRSQNPYGGFIGYSSNPFSRAYQGNLAGISGIIGQGMSGAALNPLQAEFQQLGLQQQVEQQSYAFGNKAAGLNRDLKSNSRLKAQVNAEIDQTKEAYAAFSNARQGGDKNRVTDQMVEQAGRYVAALEKMKQLEEDRVGIESKIAELNRSQIQDAIELVKIRRDQVNAQLAGEKGQYQSGVENYGMMDVGQRSLLAMVGRKYKQGGFDSLTPEESRMLLQTPLAEDVKKDSREKFGKEYEDIFYKGSAQEKRINALQGEQGQLGQIQVQLQTKLDARIEADADELSGKIVERLAPWIRKIEWAITAVEGLKQQRQDDANRKIGQDAQNNNNARAAGGGGW